MSRIAVIGAGAWGTAIALNLLRRDDHSITLCAHREAHAAEMIATRENKLYLPKFSLPEALHVTHDLASAVNGAEVVFLVVPSQHMRLTVTQMASALSHGAMLVSASKGIEDGSLLRMSEVITESLGAQSAHHPVGAHSGPSFAQEVAAGIPSAVAVAFADNEHATYAQDTLSTDTLRIYRNTDLPGVELGGALKNVIAIAAGAVAGMELGQNSIAALITRGIAEMTRLALACGGRRETLAGLSGVGDMILTCTGGLSRNRYVGMELGKGRNLEEIVQSLNGKVAEGVRTTHATLGLAQKHNVSMPITEEVHALLTGKHSAPEAVRALMGRPGQHE